MKHSKKIALCGMVAALCAAIMLLGQVTGVGLYMSPMLCGILLLPVGGLFGKKTQALTFLCVVVLSFMLVSDIEQNLMFACIFGWYPIVRSLLEKRNEPWRMLLKFAVFNAILIPLQLLLCYVLVPQGFGMWMMVLLLVLFNVTFFAYDRLIPRLQGKLEKLVRRILSMH